MQHLAKLIGYQPTRRPGRTSLSKLRLAETTPVRDDRGQVHDAATLIKSLHAAGPRPLAKS